jgi:hypothetical protein
MEGLKISGLDGLQKRIQAAIDDNPDRRQEMHGRIAERLLQTVQGEIGGSGKIAGMQESVVGSGGGYAAVRPKKGRDRSGYAYGAITNAVESGHAIRRPSGYAKGYRARIRKRYVLGKHFYQASRTAALRIALEEAGKWADEIEQVLRG